MRTAWIAVPLAALVLGACQDEADVPIVGADACGASNWTQLIGEHRSVLDDAALPEPVRIVGPNEAVTMDFVANRLNFFYDDNEVIARVECG